MPRGFAMPETREWLWNRFRELLFAFLPNSSSEQCAIAFEDVFNYSGTLTTVRQFHKLTHLRKAGGKSNAMSLRCSRSVSNHLRSDETEIDIAMHKNLRRAEFSL